MLKPFSLGAQCLFHYISNLQYLLICKTVEHVKKLSYLIVNRYKILPFPREPVTPNIHIPSMVDVIM